jgi:hypothetical protein
MKGLLGACGDDDPETALSLVDSAGAQLRCPLGATPLLYAAQWDDMGPVIAALCAARADPNAATADGLTPLMMAACRNNLVGVLALTACSASLWLRCRWGATALDYAHLGHGGFRLARLMVGARRCARSAEAVGRIVYARCGKHAGRQVARLVWRSKFSREWIRK